MGISFQRLAGVLILRSEIHDQKKVTFDDRCCYSTPSPHHLFAKQNNSIKLIGPNK